MQIDALLYHLLVNDCSLTHRLINCFCLLSGCDSSLGHFHFFKVAVARVWLVKQVVKPSKVVKIVVWAGLGLAGLAGPAGLGWAGWVAGLAGAGQGGLGWGGLGRFNNPGTTIQDLRAGLCWPGRAGLAVLAWLGWLGLGEPG